MRAGLATGTADRMFGVVVITAALMVAVVTFLLALPLAFSSPFPAAGQGDWIIRASIAQPTASTDAIAAVLAEDSETTQLADEQTTVVKKSFTMMSPLRLNRSPVQTRQAVEQVAFAARWNATGIAASEEFDDKPTGTVRFALASESSTPLSFPTQPPLRAVVPPEATRLKPVERSLEAASPRKATVNPMDAVDEYLWQVYERDQVKKDNSGDFSWKDPAAAKRMHLTLKDYVIRGMEPDFREQLYHAGHAMDAAGLHWSMLSAFRDDYRQALAAGFKARPGNSLHGGSRAVGGYGHGRAIDINNVGGDDETVWRWIDAHGAKFGLRRPMPGYDPAHIQSGGEWHAIAQGLREERTHVAANGARKTAAEASVKSRRHKIAM